MLRSCSFYVEIVNIRGFRFFWKFVNKYKEKIWKLLLFFGFIVIWIVGVVMYIFEVGVGFLWIVIIVVVILMVVDFLDVIEILDKVLCLFVLIIFFLLYNFWDKLFFIE